MANLVWLFALLCVQFSRGAFGIPAIPDSELMVDRQTWEQDEKLIEEIRDIVDDAIPDEETRQQDEKLMEEIKNMVESAFTEKTDEKDEYWTEEDQKWLEEIQSLLGEDSDEDYDMDYEEFGKLIAEIEDLMVKYHPEKSNYEWLQELGKWFLGGDYDEDYSKEGSSEELSLSYKEKSKKAGTQKRFWSV